MLAGNELKIWGDSMVKHDVDYIYVRPTRLKQITDNIMPVIILGGALGLYIKTMAPSIFWGSSSAFAISNYFLGVAQTPTYPLYTLIGRLFALLPNLTPAIAANLMSVFFAALSVMFFYMLIRRLLDVPAIRQVDYKKMMERKKLLADNPELRKERTEKLDLLPKPIENILPNLAITALYAVTLPIWLAAVRAEVYSLQLAITFAALFFMIAGVNDEKKQRLFFAGIWLYALSFANHPLMSLVFAPAFIYLIFINGFSAKRIWSMISIAVIFLAASVTMYFYASIRATVEPAVNWKQSADGLPLLSGLAYSAESIRSSLPAEYSDYLIRLKKVGLFVVSQIGWPLLILWLAAWWGIFKKLKGIGVFFVLAFLGNLLAVVWMVNFNPGNYDAVNLSAPLLGLILIVCVVGLVYLFRLSPLPNRVTHSVAVLAIAFTVVAIDNNYNKADFSKVKSPDIISTAIINQAQPGSIVMVSDEVLLQPLRYRAYAEKNAEDAFIISSDRMTDLSYRKQLLVNYPSLVFPVGFDKPHNFDPEDLARKICMLNSKMHNIYIQLGVSGIEYTQIEPAGILFKYKADEAVLNVNPIIFKRHLTLVDWLLEGNPQEAVTAEFAGRWLYALGDYYEYYKEYDIAGKLYKKALMIASENIDLRLRRAIALARRKEYKEALKYISQVLDIDSRDKQALTIGKKIVEALEKQTALASQ